MGGLGTEDSRIWACSASLGGPSTHLPLSSQPTVPWNSPRLETQNQRKWCQALSPVPRTPALCHPLGPKPMFRIICGLGHGSCSLCIEDLLCLGGRAWLTDHGSLQLTTTLRAQAISWGQKNIAKTSESNPSGGWAPSEGRRCQRPCQSSWLLLIS